jgi:hypothetical protein
MKANYYLYTFLLIFLITACSKDKFETRPTIEVKEYNTKNLKAATEGESYWQVVLKYTDKEGDLVGGSLNVTHTRLNKRPLGSGDVNRDSIIGSFAIDNIQDKRTTGELLLRFSHNFLKDSRTENDSIKFNIWLLDRAQNSSDTLVTDMIVIEL